MSDIEHDIYRNALEESVHFSVKTINSNIEKGGLRLSQKQALDLPYLSARTLLNENFLIPTDYQANAGKTASIFKVVKAAMLDDDISEETPEFQQEVKQLKPTIAQVFDEPYQAGIDHLDIRMRQLLIPKDDGYISISPMTAAGVNCLINQEVDQINEASKTKESSFNRIQMAVFGIGGANPQNVGSLVRAMQRPITLDSPKLDADISLGFRVFYKGFEYYIPNKIIIKDDQEIIPDIIQWAKMLEQQLIATAQNNHQDWYDIGIYSPETNLKLRQAEISFLKSIFNLVNFQGEKYLQLLKKIEHDLPTLSKEDEIDQAPLTPLLHPRVPLVIQGLIVPELRNDTWVIQFSDHLANKIIGQTFYINSEQQPIKIPLDENAKAFLARRLREIIR